MPILRSCVGRRRREPKNHSALKVGVKNICLAAAGAESFFGPLYLCAPDVNNDADLAVSQAVSHELHHTPRSSDLFWCISPPEGRRGRDRRKRHEYQDLR